MKYVILSALVSIFLAGCGEDHSSQHSSGPTTPTATPTPQTPPPAAPAPTPVAPAPTPQEEPKVEPAPPAPVPTAQPLAPQTPTVAPSAPTADPGFSDLFVKNAMLSIKRGDTLSTMLPEAKQVLLALGVCRSFPISYGDHSLRKECDVRKSWSDHEPAFHYDYTVAFDSKGVVEYICRPVLDDFGNDTSTFTCAA